jgi:hypothetical protein
LQCSKLSGVWSGCTSGDKETEKTNRGIRTPPGPQIHSLYGIHRWKGKKISEVYLRRAPSKKAHRRKFTQIRMTHWVLQPLMLMHTGPFFWINDWRLLLRFRDGPFIEFFEAQ